MTKLVRCNKAATWTPAGGGMIACAEDSGEYVSVADYRAEQRRAAEVVRLLRTLTYDRPPSRDHYLAAVRALVAYEEGGQ